MEEALAHYHEALRLKPDFAEAYNSLGLVLKEQGRRTEALRNFQEALRLKPNYVEAHANMGLALKDDGQLAEAMTHYREALRMNPNCAERTTTWRCLPRLGDFDSAVVHFQETLRLNPNLGSAYHNLASCGRYRFSDADVNAARNLLEDPRLSSWDKCALHFTLGDVLDQRDCCAKAFEHYRQGNNLRRQFLHQRGLTFNPSGTVNVIEQIIATFDSAYFKRIQSFGLDTELPVFIVGMPRSGTTLVEQILCSHPQVFGAGELPDIPQLIGELPALLSKLQYFQERSGIRKNSVTAPGILANSATKPTNLGSTELPMSPKTAEVLTPDPYPVCMAGIQRPVVQTMAERCVQHLAQLGGGASRVIDKLPDNRRHLGLIYTLFPKARIIHCRRDPLDTCLSCYFQDFTWLNFTTSLEDIALIYQLYRKTMAHWHAVLPAPFLRFSTKNWSTTRKPLAGR